MSPRSWCSVRVCGTPVAATCVAASTAPASNSAHPSVPRTAPPGSIVIRLPTRHGGDPIAFTAVASTWAARPGARASGPVVAAGVGAACACPVGCAPVAPPSSCTACGTTGSSASSDSATPLGLPGRLTTRASPTTPATARDRAAIGVCASPAARMSSASPGASRSMAARVASGVTSRGPNPVPPVVTTRAWVAASRRSASSIRSRSSGTTSRVTTSKPAPLRSVEATSPLSSVRVPCVTPSETVTTAARAPAMRSILPRRRLRRRSRPSPRTPRACRPRTPARPRGCGSGAGGAS